MANQKQVPRWSLLQHLRDLGMEPEAPYLPVWEDIENYWGADFKRTQTITQELLDKFTDASLATAPLITTLYRWAQKEKIDIYPIRGPVMLDKRVNHAMEEYVLNLISRNPTTYNETLDIYLYYLQENNLLSPKLHDAFNTYNNKNGPADRNVWIGVHTGVLPECSSWSDIAKEINRTYVMTREDLQVFTMDANTRNWTQYTRMDLILAAWLESGSRYVHIPLYSHLPRVSMDKPDEVSAVFWMVITAHIEKAPNSIESKMLQEWMDSYPDYQKDFNDKRPLLMGVFEDPLICGRQLMRMFSTNNKVKENEYSLSDFVV